MSLEAMDCAEFLGIALAEVDGEGSQSNMTLVIAHLQAYVPCAREYRVQQQVKLLVQRTAGCSVAPEGLRVRIMSSIRQTSDGTYRQVDMAIEIDGGSAT